MDISAHLNQQIEALISLSDEELKVFHGFFTKRSLKKNEFFLEEGQICKHIGFVDTGAILYTKNLDNGNEITTDFAFAGDWITNNLSRLNQTPSLINIKAAEPTELFMIQQEDLNGLYTRIPKLERLGRILMEQAYLKIVQQNIDLQVLSATERYENLLSKYPDIFQKMPLYHIANYLGIAPKSLSRIRSQIFRK